MKVFGGFLALHFLMTLRATVVITEIVHAGPKKLGDFIKIESAPNEVEEAGKIIDTAPENMEPAKIINTVPEKAEEATKTIDKAPEEVNEATKIINVSVKEKDESPARENCRTCVKLDSVCYNRTYLFELTATFRPEIVIKKMGILRSKNLLFYSFEPPIDDPEYFKVAYVSLDSHTSVRTHFIKDNNLNFGVFDINQRENQIFLGGSDGIWVIKNPNKATPEPKFFAAKGFDISNVIVRDYVYFSKQYYPGIIKDKDGTYDFILQDNTVENFVLDKDVEYNVVYINASGMFAFNSKTYEEVTLSNNRFFRGLTVDLDGVVYAWYLDGIYKVFFNEVYSRSKLTRVSTVEVGAMTFDQSNDIIYTKEKSLYKLTNLYTTEC